MRKGFVFVTVLGLFLLVLVPIIFYTLLATDKKIAKQDIVTTHRTYDNTLMVLNFLRAPCDRYLSICDGSVSDYIIRNYENKGLLTELLNEFFKRYDGNYIGRKKVSIFELTLLPDKKKLLDVKSKNRSLLYFP